MLHGLAHLFDVDVEFLRQLFDVRRTVVCLRQACARLADLRDGADPVERQAHDAALLGERLKNCLANPPDGIGDKLEATGFIEALRGFDETVVTFVDQVGKRKSLSLVLLSHRNDKTEVGSRQFVQSFLIALFDTAC